MWSIFFMKFNLVIKKALLKKTLFSAICNKRKTFMQLIENSGSLQNISFNY